MGMIWLHDCTNNGRPTTMTFSISVTWAEATVSKTHNSLQDIYNVILMPDTPVHVRSLPRIFKNFQQLFLRPNACTSSFYSSFFPSIIAFWNRLPQAVQESNSILLPAIFIKLIMPRRSAKAHSSRFVCHSVILYVCNFIFSEVAIN